VTSPSHTPIPSVLLDVRSKRPPSSCPFLLVLVIFAIVVAAAAEELD